MIGDGMGLSQISAYLYANGNRMNFEQFKVIGFQKTQSVDNLVTDSAGAATAMSCGTKSYNSAIGVDADTIPCKTILEEAEERGWATGLVATSHLVDATPASFIAHQRLRNFYELIAADYLHSEVDLIIGGGAKYFYNRESDNRNLLAEFSNKGYRIRRQIPSLKDASKYKKLVCMTADDKPLAVGQGRDYLPYASSFAINFLDKKTQTGFFLMIEGSQIDWACHANNATMMLEEMKDFDYAIGKVLDFARSNGETLVIVTGDHECGGCSIVGGNLKFRNPKIKFTTNGHTAAMVPVFAFGPKAELFSGIYENTAIHEKMREAFGWE